MKKLTIRIVLLVAGGFLAGNALWNILKFEPTLSVAAGAVLILVGLGCR